MLPSANVCRSAGYELVRPTTCPAVAYSTYILFLGLSLVFSLPAQAMPFFPDRVPNGRSPSLNVERACMVCHFDRNGSGAKNQFGRDFELFPEWERLYRLDSDGDGQSNGLELGDPDGIWRPGLKPSRTTNISLPGDRSSLSRLGGKDAGSVAVPPDSGSAEADVGGVNDLVGSGSTTSDASATGAPALPDNSPAMCACSRAGQPFFPGLSVVLLLGALLVVGKVGSRRAHHLSDRGVAPVSLSHFI